MTKAQGWLAALLLALISPALRADDSPRVGSLGEPARFEIEGAKSFTADEIRQALFNELDVVAAGDAGAPLAALVKLLEEKATSGYQCAGFPDAKVVVTEADGSLKATIDEGERFAMGVVEVVGNQAVDTERLLRDLDPPAGKGLKQRRFWRPGEPAPFDTNTVAWLTSKIESLISDQGYYRPRLNVTVVPDRESKKANLRIEVTDSGPLTTAADLNIVGNDTNSSESVRTYLGLESQAPLTRELRERIERELRRSGRFISVRWELGDHPARDDAWRPRLVLGEYDVAPPLTEALTREEQALLKLAEWIERFEESDEEVLIRLPCEKISVSFAPRRGFIVMFGAPDKAAASDAAPAFVSALVMAEERVGIYSLTQRRKIDAAPPPAPITGQAVLTLIGGAPSWDGRSALMLGAGLSRSTQNGYRRHMTIQFRTAASAALSVVRKHEAKCEWDGETVRIEWNRRMLRIDSATGRLIEQVVKDEPSAEKEAAKAKSDWSAHVTTNSGEFERRLTEIEQLTADWTNVADARRPLSCIGELICGELAQFDADSREGYAALQKMVSLGVLEPFDELIREACEPEKSGFTVPRPHWEVKSLNDLAAAVRILAPIFGVRLGNYLLPADGWLNPVWQNGVFALAGKPVRLSGQLSGQHWDDRGPVCELLVAETMRAAGMNMLSATFARQGLRRLTPAAFRQDYTPLLSGQGFVSKLLLRLTEVMRQLDAQEVEALCKLLARGGLLDPAKAEPLRQCITALRSKADDSPAEAAGKALDAAWQAGLSQLVEWRLNTLLPERPKEPALAVLPNGTPAFLPAEPPQPPKLDRYGRPIFAGLPTDTPAPTFQGYGAAPPQSAERQIPAMPEGEREADGGTLPESSKSLRQEIKELRVLSQTLSKRLAELEDRIVEEPDDSAIGPISEDGALIGPPLEQKCMFELRGPNGLKWIPTWIDPGRFNIQAGKLPTYIALDPGSAFQFRLTNIAGHEKETLYAVLRVAPPPPDKVVPYPRTGVPVTITSADLDTAIAGQTVTKRVCLRDEKDTDESAAVSQEALATVEITKQPPPALATPGSLEGQTNE